MSELKFKNNPKPKPIYFIQIKETHEHTWMNSAWKDVVIPVTIDHSLSSDDRLIFAPYTFGDPMAPFCLPFNACIASNCVIPITQEEAQAHHKKCTGVDARVYPEYDPTPLVELYPNVVWYSKGEK